MLIQTLDKIYIVVKSCVTDSKLEKYVCRDSEKQGYVALFRTRNRPLIAKTVEFLTRESTSRAFTDFKRYFVSNEYFCIVMAYYEGESLKTRLEREYCTLEERLGMGKRILEKIILLDMPIFFLCDSLKPEQIIVKRSLDVEFNYNLTDLEHYENYEFSRASDQFADIMEFLFGEELKKRKIPALTQFSKTLEKGLLESYMDIYQRYQEVCTQIQSMSQEEIQRPKTWMFLLWDRMKIIGKPLKHGLAAILFMIAVVYLIYTTKLVQNTGENQKIFRYIGTLELER